MYESYVYTDDVWGAVRLRSCRAGMADNTYVQQAVCGPSRNSFLTGETPPPDPAPVLERAILWIPVVVLFQCLVRVSIGRRLTSPTNVMCAGVF